MGSTCKDTSEEEANGSMVVQRIYRQGLGTFTQDGISLYKRVIIPKIIYEAVAWQDRMGIARAEMSAEGGMYYKVC